MGLFDKLKKLVSDDSADAGAIEIMLLSGEIHVKHRDDCRICFAASRKIVEWQHRAIKPAGDKMHDAKAQLTFYPVRSSKLTTHSL